MRFLIPILLFLILASCSNRYQHEDELCQCYQSAYQEFDLNFYDDVDELEAYLIKQQILQDQSGASYKALIKSILETEENPGLDWQKYRNQTQMMQVTKTSQDCSLLRLESRGSKVNDINDDMIAALNSRDIDDLTVWSVYYKNLDEKDLDHRFYKAEIILALSLWDQVKSQEDDLGRLLPVEREPFIDAEISIRDRDIVQIKADSDDSLWFERESIDIDDLEEAVHHFYTANKYAETDPHMPEFTLIDIGLCEFRLAEISKELEFNPEDVYWQDLQKRWEFKKEICADMPNGEYHEISSMAIIRLENQAGTSYGLYVQIQNIIKKVVRDLRTDYCKEIYGRDYYQLDESVEEDQQIIRKLRILVPERIVEAKMRE